jgi:hypothetical protein
LVQRPAPLSGYAFAFTTAPNKVLAFIVYFWMHQEGRRATLYYLLATPVPGYDIFITATPCLGFAVLFTGCALHGPRCIVSTGYALHGLRCIIFTGCALHGLRCIVSLAAPCLGYAVLLPLATPCLGYAVLSPLALLSNLPFSLSGEKARCKVI